MPRHRGALEPGRQRMMTTRPAGNLSKRRARQRSRAFTMIELLITMEVGMIIAGMALPNVKTSRKQADEASAVSSLRQLSDAQELYRPRQSPPCYAPSLQRLRAAGLIDETLAGGEKAGYIFQVNGEATAQTYAFTAIASVQGSSGDRSFYVDQTGIIRMENDASVSYISPPLQ